MRNGVLDAVGSPSDVINSNVTGFAYLYKMTRLICNISHVMCRW